MRKIPRHCENPIDNFLIDIADWISPKLYSMGFTPNMITTIGVILRGFSVYYLLKNQKNKFLILAIFSYFLDCLDGHYARKYNMCTKFGDYYDHVTDLIYDGILLFILIKYSTLSKAQLFGVMGFLATIKLLFLYHLGCQENIYQCQGDTCSVFFQPLKQFCQTNPDNVQLSKYFGCGTQALAVYLTIYFIPLSFK